MKEEDSSRRLRHYPFVIFMESGQREGVILARTPDEAIGQLHSVMRGWRGVQRASLFSPDTESVLYEVGA